MKKTVRKPQRKPRRPPHDPASFARWIRARTNRIQVLIAHLRAPKHSHDLGSRRLLERLVDERGSALSNPPETIPRDTVEALKEEVRHACPGH